MSAVERPDFDELASRFTHPSETAKQVSRLIDCARAAGERADEAETHEARLRVALAWSTRALLDILEAHPLARTEPAGWVVRAGAKRGAGRYLTAHGIVWAEHRAEARVFAVRREAEAAAEVALYCCRVIALRKVKP